MEYLIVLVVLGVVVYAVSAPLRSARQANGAQSGSVGSVAPDPVAELEAARDAKYREIRDAELDVRTGKLSDADYRSLDATLRAQAIQILNDLDLAREAEQVPSAP